MTEAVIVVRCLPPPECNPNSRVHWRKKSRAVKWFRAQSFLAAKYEGTEAVKGYIGDDAPIRLDVEIAWRGRKSMDDDNARASLKPLIDGLADYLWGGRDDHVTIRSLVQTQGEGTITVTLQGGGS